MSKFLKANEAHFLFHSDGRPQGDLEVLEFSGTEQISAPFHFQLQLVCKDVDVDLEGIIDAEACLTLKDGVGDRHIHGLISQAQIMGRRLDFVVYQATLVPTLWRLGLITQSRIFQKESTPNIITQVLENAGIKSDRFRLELTGNYTPRDYCVQYRESDLNFIHRLMEEEGLFYFFEHGRDQHLLVISDDKIVHSELPRAPMVRYREGGGMTPGERSIHRFSMAHMVNTGKVVQRDYSYKKPTLDLDAEDESSRFAELFHYEYPGEYVDAGLGKGLTKLKRELLESVRQVGRGSSDSPQLCPGFLTSLAHHFRFELNRCYLLSSVRHRGQQPQVLGEAGGGSQRAGYSNTFRVIKDDVQYRPPRRTPRPLITGLQTATVLGPEGQEIYTDEDARIKVRFHWDRGDSPPDQSSCWIRVAQAWAGSGFGAVCVPRIGHEVVVQFLEGDPDRPLITGSVYNGNNRPPYGPPESNTRTTLRSNSTPGGGGFNEFRFEDKAGEEEIFLHGQKDFNITILNDQTRSVGNDSTESVGHDRSETVGNDHRQTIGRNFSETVVKNRTRMVGGDEAVAISGNQNVAVSKSFSHETTKEVFIQAGVKMVLQGPGGSITIDASGVTIEGVLVRIN